MRRGRVLTHKVLCVFFVFFIFIIIIILFFYCRTSFFVSVLLTICLCAPWLWFPLMPYSHSLIIFLTQYWKWWLGVWWYDNNGIFHKWGKDSSGLSEHSPHQLCSVSRCFWNSQWWRGVLHQVWFSRRCCVCVCLSVMCVPLCRHLHV